MCNDGDWRRNISRDHGDNMGDIRVDYSRCGSRSKNTRYYSSCNNVETVDGCSRSGYRSHSTHSYSHNKGYHSRLLRIFFASHYVNDSFHDNVRVDSMGGVMEEVEVFLDISAPLSFTNYIHSVVGYVRSGYRSQTIPSPSHHSVDLGRLLGFSICVHDINEKYVSD